MKASTTLIPIHQPYDFSTVLGFLKRHAAYGIEEIKENIYTRHFPYQNSNGSIRVALHNKSHLSISITGSDSNENILNKVKNLFDTDHDPASLPIRTGVRVVGCFDPFEAAISIILGQLVSIQQATQKLKQLIIEFGKNINDSLYVFPAPKDLSNQEIEKIGITKIKAGAIRMLSLKIENREFSFSKDISTDLIEKQLLSIKGIGPWTAQIILMRCFIFKDAFPKNDLFIKAAIEAGHVDESSWQGRRSYLTHYLWEKSIKKKSNQR